MAWDLVCWFGEPTNIQNKLEIIRNYALRYSILGRWDQILKSQQCPARYRNGCANKLFVHGPIGEEGRRVIRYYLVCRPDNEQMSTENEKYCNFNVSINHWWKLTFRIVRMTEYFWVSMKDSSMTRMAILTSSSMTCSRKWSLACASAIRIILSMWRTVIGMLPVAYDAMQWRIKKENKSNQTKPYHWLSSEIAVHTRNLILVDLMQLWMYFFTSVCDVFSQEILRNFFDTGKIGIVHVDRIVFHLIREYQCMTIWWFF